ncbi:MAG: hypothetical protein IJ590_04205, partial [Rickettsiales bacterium]|nr:hypothetical protein [Rickettsiales bacterium]
MEGIDKSELEAYGIKKTEEGKHNYMLTHMIGGVGAYYNGINIEQNYKNFFKNAKDKENNDKQTTKCTIQYENNGKMNVKSYSCIGYVFDDGYYYKQMFDRNVNSGYYFESDGQRNNEDGTKKTNELGIIDKEEDLKGIVDIMNKEEAIKVSESNFVNRQLINDNQLERYAKKHVFKDSETLNKHLKKAKKIYKLVNKGKIDKNSLSFESIGYSECAKPDYGLMEFHSCYNNVDNPDSISGFCISADDDRIEFTYDDNEEFKLDENYNNLTKKMKTKVSLNECIVSFNEKMHIASMFISLTDDDSVKDSKRGKQLKLIVDCMQQIINVQKKKMGKDKILFRDMKTQKLELLSFEKFKERICKLVEEFNKSEHKNYLDEDWKIEIPNPKIPNSIKQSSGGECCIKKFL